MISKSIVSQVYPRVNIGALFFFFVNNTEVLLWKHDLRKLSDYQGQIRLKAFLCPHGEQCTDKAVIHWICFSQPFIMHFLSNLGNNPQFEVEKHFTMTI